MPILLVLSRVSAATPEVARPAAPPVNLDFEAGAAPDGRPLGWGGGGDGYVLSLDAEGHVAEVRHVRGRGWASLTQCASAEPWRGRRLAFRGRLATEAVGSAGLWMRVDRGDRSAAFDNSLGRRRSGTTAWAEAETVVLDVPDDATRVCYGLLVEGRGSARVDDLSIETVTPEVASTDLAVDPLETPLNLDFAAGLRGWKAGGIGYEIEPGDGVRITRTARPHDPRAGVAQCVQARDWRGHGLTVSSELGATDAGAARLWIAVEGAHPSRSDDGVRGTATRPVEVGLEVPADAETICFGAYLAGAGDLHVGPVTLKVR